jgi:hypothetical protein
MTNNADNVSGQAPSLLPTGRQGSSSESVSILRDLDPRSTKLGASPSFPYKTVLLVAAPLAIGVALLSGYLYSDSQEEGAGALPARAAEPPVATVLKETSVPVSPAAPNPSETVSNPPQEGQGPAIILAPPDAGGSGAEQPKPNPLSILAEDNTGQQSPTSTSSIQDKATGKNGGATTSEQAKAKTTHKPPPIRHSKNSNTNKAKSGGGEKKVIEHEIDIVTAIVKGAQN